MNLQKVPLARCDENWKDVKRFFPLRENIWKTSLEMCSFFQALCNYKQRKKIGVTKNKSINTKDKIAENFVESENESNWIDCCGMKWILFRPLLLSLKLIDWQYVCAKKKWFYTTMYLTEFIHAILGVSLPINWDVRWISFKMLQSRDFSIPAKDWKHLSDEIYDITANFMHNLFMTQHFANVYSHRLLFCAKRAVKFFVF